MNYAIRTLLRKGRVRGETWVAESPSAELLGLVTFCPIPLKHPATRGIVSHMEDARQIRLLARQLKFRGSRFPDGRTIGEALLEEAFVQIAGNSPRVPGMWAMVQTGDEHTHAVLERHGFKYRIDKCSRKRDYDYRIRMPQGA